MAKAIEIRWHGRGGQGAKTAALLLGDAMLGAGKHMQAFPEYGPERMGAPVRAYTRVSDEPIVIHSGVDTPDVVVVLDHTLIGGSTDVTEGLNEGGAILINSPLKPDEVRRATGISGHKVFTVDASRISVEAMGAHFPNTPMLGALARATGMIKLEPLLDSLRHKLKVKFRNKPEIIEGNLDAVRRAYQEVTAE